MILTENLLIKTKTYRLHVEDLLILYCKFYNNSWLGNAYMPSHIAYFRLKSRKYLDNTGLLTNLGVSLCKDLFEANLNEEIDYFDQFWSVYPSSDKWANYPMTRALKNNKFRCKTLYNTLLKEGVNPEDILKGLDREIETRKRNSNKENSMKFMQASSTWLNNRTFEAWLDKEEITPDSLLYGKDLN